MGDSIATFDFDLHVLRRIIVFQRACRLTTLSSLALLLYDHIITVREEVNLVWQSPRSTAKAVFLLNRYFPLLFLCTYTTLMFDSSPSYTTCWYNIVYNIELHTNLRAGKVAFDFQAWSAWVGAFLVEILLQFWVVSVYRPRHLWKVAMVSSFVLLSVSSATGLTLVLRKIHVEIEMPGCTLMTGDAAEAMKVLLGAEVGRAPPLIFVCLLPSVAYELFLLALLVRKAVQFYRASSGTLLTCPNKNPVARVLIRDSVTYFVIILAIYVANALTWTFAPSQLFQIGVGFGLTLPSLLGSRLLLNLRDAHARTHRFTPTVSLSHMYMTHWDQLSVLDGCSDDGAAAADAVSRRLSAVNVPVNTQQPEVLGQTNGR